MDHRSPFYEEDYPDTTSTWQRGGCFSLVLIPLVIAFLFTALVQFSGSDGTTQPWDLNLGELPVSAKIVIELNGPGGTDQNPSSGTTADVFGDPQPALAAGSTRAEPAAQTNLRIADFFAPSVKYWEDDILRWAAAAGLDPNLVATVMQIESCGDPKAVSRAGAMSLFQVMPYHFLVGENPFDPDTNALRGLNYLKDSLDKHQDPRLAMAGYNGGINTASKSEQYWPQETIRYAYWGSGIYLDAHMDQPTSTRLDEWYAAGGISLCRQAEAQLGITP